MAKERMINTKFWDDSYIVNLDPIEKLLYLYFLTNPLTNICGIYEIQLRRIAFDTGIDKDMVQKVIDRFSKDDKIYFIDGWLAIKNFAKHQRDNPSVKKGIEISLKDVPKSILDRLSTDSTSLSHLNLNSNLNINPKIVASDTPFSLKEEIKKLEDSPRRDMNIIALYLDHRKPDLQNRQQYSETIKRHLKPAISLKSFTDSQILKALDYCKKEYKDIYTLETLMKVLTK